MTPHARVLHACVRLACVGVTGGGQGQPPAAAIDHGLSGLLYGRISAFCPETAGIGASPLKGPALSQSAFGDPSLRHFVDLDLLVRTADGLAAGVGSTGI